MKSLLVVASILTSTCVYASQADMVAFRYERQQYCKELSKNLAKAETSKSAAVQALDCKDTATCVSKPQERSKLTEYLLMVEEYITSAKKVHAGCK